MSYKLSFGEYKGKSIEWLFFHAPWHVQWLHTETVEGRWKWYNPVEKDYFDELYRRSSSFIGLCPWCKAQPFTRMSLNWEYRSGSLVSVSFHCDKCDFPGAANYARPAFFVPLLNLPWREQPIIVEAIKRQFIGDGNLTQRKMEQFFQTDANFPRATQGFFAV